MGCCNSKHDQQFNEGDQDIMNKELSKSCSIKSDPFGLEHTHEVLESLGRGGTGETWLCRSYKTGQLEAVKLIKRPIPKVIVPMVLEEIKIQGDLGEGHLNIVNAHEVFLTKTHLALCMEFAAAGSLTNYVADRWQTTQERGGLFLTEDEARFLFKQFLSAVEYCHSHRVAHRDLKLDNTLLDGSKPPLIKICDFGFAKTWGDVSHNMFTQIGTPVYMSPQLVNTRNGDRGYDGTKADVWASGVLLFVMLLGMFPFEQDDHPNPSQSAAYLEVWLQQIKSSWRENPRVAKYARRLSPECRDLLDRIFQLDENRRISVQEIKSHPWYVKPLAPEYQAAWEDIQRRQKRIDKMVKIGLFQNTKRDNALKEMIQEAATLPGSSTEAAEEPVAIDLRRVATHKNLLQLNMQEDDEEEEEDYDDDHY
eukprot:TRINITY_DN533_c0_g1_i1.p1 TRINITY_DN533_c0_g1~~TRINITY_DN533_c0_g1_i1.p1  ORF type:complete len:422 (-),score=65.27 TRINITY_DN533_c0_g1_i1:537-1802(-)